METIMENRRMVAMPLLNDPEVIVWDGITSVVQQNFRRFGADGLRVTVFSRRTRREQRRVLLDSEVFDAVELSEDEAQLILTHLHAPFSTEAVFAMAQAIEMGTDIDLVYDTATGRLRTPHARRKAVAA